jgi:hypothetical protein
MTKMRAKHSPWREKIAEQGKFSGDEVLKD